MHRLQKRDTNCRKVLPVGLKLGLTLHCLATGIGFLEMHNGWHVGYGIVGKVIIESAIPSFKNFKMKRSRLQQTRNSGEQLLGNILELEQIGDNVECQHQYCVY